MFGVVPFVKMAGRSLGKIFKGDDTKARLEKEIKALGLEGKGIEITIGDDGTVKVTGKAVDQAMKEKIILAIGNVEGVAAVDDGIEVENSGSPSQFHTVISGDTLWKISETYYGKGSRYPEIFEANRPMLSHPDKIYVGQVLRIPADGADKAAMV